MARMLVWIVPLLVLFCGCDAFYDVTGIPRPEGQPNANDNSKPAESGKVGLRQFNSEEEFEEYFGEQVASENRYGYRGGDLFEADEDVNAAPVSGGEGSGGQSPDPAAPTDDGAANGDGGTEGFSETTTQEEGVQEADIIKNDGQYIYVLSGSVLHIVQAAPGEALATLSSLDLEGYGRDLYLVTDRVVAITYAIESFYGAIDDDSLVAQVITPSPYYYQSRVQVTVVNVADRSNPAIESTTWFEGDLASSRMIGETLHLVLANYPEFYEPILMFDGERTAIAEANADKILPDYQSSMGDDVPVGGNIVGWDNFYYPIDPDGYGTTMVLSLDINAPADFNAVGVVAYPGNIYASTEALYLTDTDYNFFGDVRQMTDIYKFAFTDDGPMLVATGAVPGRILNQYSMSEYEGYLRVATTVDRRGDFFAQEQSPSTNHVYVLDEQGDELSVVGAAENLAPTEQIKSARFSGPRGYLVTFEQIDPLFTLDMSDPTNPQVIGELKVPGYSTFIMEMGTDHLLTIGEAVVDEGGWVRPEGVQLSVFDISDFANPTLLHKTEIGNPDAWSEALYNPKALTYYAAEGLLAIPVELYSYMDFDDGRVPEPEIDEEFIEGDDGEEVGSGGDEENGTGGNDGDVDEPGDEPISVEPALPPWPEDSFYGIYVYRVTPEGGFEKLGEIDAVTGDYRYSSFLRGVFVGANVFAVSDHAVMGSPVSDLSTVSWEVMLP